MAQRSPPIARSSSAGSPHLNPDLVPRLQEGTRDLRKRAVCTQGHDNLREGGASLKMALRDELHASHLIVWVDGPPVHFTV